MARPRILMIGHYNVERVDAAPKVRITRLREALAEVCDLTFYSDTRGARRGPLRALMKQIPTFDAVYVEAASSTADETDLWFLMECKRHGVPVGLYVRDAYQLYPTFYDNSTWKNKILKLGWHISIAAYERLASVLYFPTRGLSEHFRHPRKLMLPPAGRLVPGVDRSQVERRVVYVGGISQEYGIDLLLEAMDVVVARDPTVKLTMICKTPNHPLIVPYHDRPWLELKQLEADELLPEMNRAAVAVIPFRPNDYPALSVKLLDYLSYGLPVVATPWRDVMAFIQAHGCGRIGEATPQGLAAALLGVLSDPKAAHDLSEAALATIQQGNSWGDRARYLLETLLAK